MPDSGPVFESAGARVCAAVAAADARRRSRERRRHAWRIAPYAASLALCAALIGAARGWPAVLPVVVLGLGLCTLIAYAFIGWRGRAVPDSAAAAIDADAALGGELRSANWFADRDARDPWAEFHVNRAAERIEGIDWSAVYPSVPNRRAQLATGVIGIGALLLPLALPEFPRVGTTINKDAAPKAGMTVTRPLAQGLPVDLPEDLEALLSAAESGTLRIENAADVQAVQKLIDKLAQLHGTESLKQLARAMAPDADPARPQSTEAVLKVLADRAEHAARNLAVPPPLRDALESLSNDLSQLAKAERAANADPREALPAETPPEGDTVQTSAAGKKDEMSIQAVRDADAGGGAGVLMIADPGAFGRDPGSGLGGGSGVDAQQGRMADIAQALRRETVEASANSEGSDVLSEQRRKSERGQATVSFTHSAARTFDSGRRAAPPAVPEGRRAAIQSYFVRKQ